MKKLRSITVLLLMVIFAASAYSQGNKTTVLVPLTWDENLVAIPCIGSYSGTIYMSMTFFDSGIGPFQGKVLNKASGEVTASDSKVYTIKSVFNCNLFSARTSASELSVQSMTFTVRCKKTGKIVATIHTTWHYDTNGVEENPYMVNYQAVCH